MKLDEKLEQLKTITEKLDDENVTFDEGILLFENGVSIAKECLTAINEAKGKIAQIKQDLESYKEEELK